MAEKGNLFLKNSAVIAMYDDVKTYETTVQDALYSQYKTAYKISVSNYFRGNAADAFKNYISNGTINIISGLLDISSDMSMIIQLCAEAFYQYEMNHDGRVEEGALDYIGQTVDKKESVFEGARYELDTVLQLASKYIATKGLSLSSVNNGYANIRSTVKKIREDLYQVDDEALKSAEELLSRITKLRKLIEKTMAYCYSDDGKINADNLNSIQNQEWFQTAGNVTLYLLLQEDPFEYVAGEVTVAEDQWAAGLCSDVYAYAGYSFLSASGEAGVENGTAFAKGKASVLAANGYAQFTDYLNASAEVKVAYAEGEAKAGWSDEYKGFRVEAGVGLLKADGSVVVGSEEINAYIKGEVQVLCADGKVAFEFEEDGQYAIGVDASATLASAEVKGGTTIFSYKSKDTATGEKETLLGFKIGAEANAGGSFAIWSESKTAFETEYVNVNATTVKIDAALLLGIDVAVTVPTLYFKWPW